MLLLRGVTAMSNRSSWWYAPLFALAIGLGVVYSGFASSDFAQVSNLGSLVADR
jgi:hypothetical protein